MVVDAYHTVQIQDAQGNFKPFTLALDDKGHPLFKSSFLNPIHEAVQVGEATYANFLPRISGVYSQPDLSDGMGIKTQKTASDTNAKRYYYSEWLDASVPGQIQKGPAITTLTPPTNSGALNGYFELGGSPYLNLGRIIARYNVGADSLTQVRDLGSGKLSSGATVFNQLGTETLADTSAAVGSPLSLTTADQRIAQRVVSSETTMKFLGRVDMELYTSGSPLGNVTLSVMSDLNGRPSNQIITTASLLAASLPTSSGSLVSFRFDDDITYLITPGEPYWLVLDADSVSVTGPKSVIATFGASGYANGPYSFSSDQGNSWTPNANSNIHFAVYTKAQTQVAWIGADDGTTKFATTPDGTSYTADTYRFSTLFTTVSDRVVRDIRAGATRGCIQYSTDGVNWSEAITVGDPNTQITWLGAQNGNLIVAKTDSIWAVDVVEATITAATLQQLYYSTPNSTNGIGSRVWKNTSYIPFNGRLMSIEGSFVNGFTIHTTIGPESMDEWDAPWGQGHVVAVAGSRYHLYAAVSTSTGYRLFKSSDPINAKWHGSIATLGDGTQDLHEMDVYDPGGSASGSPLLFFTTTGNNVGVVILPRVKNPATDPNYLYDISSDGRLYYPRATGNFAINPKAWVNEAFAFQERGAGGDWVDMLYDTLDGSDYRRLPTTDHVYDTGVVPYPVGEGSIANARQLILHNTTTATSPILQATGLTYAVRLAAGLPLRQLTFTIEAETGLSADDVGDILGLGEVSMEDLLVSAAQGVGTRTVMILGRTYRSVLFLNTEPTLVEVKDEEPRMAITITAVQVG